MMNRIKKTVAVLLAASLLTALLTACNDGTAGDDSSTPVVLKEIYDHVFDAGTYTSLDYDYAEEFFAGTHDNYGGGCTAIAKVTDAGETLVGRNMDLNISNKAAYVFRTAVPGCYKTVNLEYTFRDVSPDYKDAKANGLTDSFSKILPFMADDVLNEKGLYVEVNMRYGESWPTGESKFSCSGTNPDADQRVYMFTLARYIGEHCATVDEALEYVKTLDIYSENGYWNYCYLIADATGHYGVLEFGMNKVIWNEKQPAQANFYVNEELAKNQQLKAGVGRYNKVMEGIGAVQNEDQMFKLMDSASYFQVYDVDNCQFDPRTENVGALPFADYEFVMKEENREMIMSALRLLHLSVAGLSRPELRAANEYWESTFTEVINCNKRTLFVRFYEDDQMTLTLGFDE